MSKDQGTVLVACPTYAGKEYALEEYLAGYEALDYDPKPGLYMVDNTAFSDGYFKRLQREGIKCSRIIPWPDFEPTFRKCWELIYEEAEREDYYWIYSIEADNINAPESLQVMVNIALYANIHLVTHTYPMHKTAAEASGIEPDSFKYEELGCMLISTKLLGRALEDYEEHKNVPLAIFAAAQKWQGGRCTLTHSFETKHLDGYEMEFWQFNEVKDERLFSPAPVSPEDYGTVIPPSMVEDLKKRA